MHKFCPLGSDGARRMADVACKTEDEPSWRSGYWADL